MVRRSEFSCKRCGSCCRLLLSLSEDDVRRLEKAGFDRKKFLRNHPIDPYGDDGRPFMNVKDDSGSEECYFLRKDSEGKYYCGAYENRPEGCRKYPFVLREDIGSCHPDEVLK